MDVAIRIDAEASDGKRNVFWNDELSHHVQETELRAILEDARSNLWKSSEQNGLVLGSRLYQVVNGSGRQLDAALTESRNQGTPLHISLDVPFEIDALPFELLRHKEQFLLLDSDTHLNRKITDRNRLRPTTPEKRALKLLFMACSPLDLPDTNSAIRKGRRTYIPSG